LNSSPTSKRPLAYLQDLDSSEGLFDHGTVAWPGGNRPTVNAHIHLPPNFSAFESIDEVLDLACKQSIGVLGTSNYYDYSVYATYTEKALRLGVFPLYGLEVIVKVDDLAKRGININDPGVPGKMYFCGKAITRFLDVPEPAKTTLSTLQTGDAQLIANQIDIIAKIFQREGLETGLDASVVKQQVAARHACSPDTVFLQERHVAQAFQQALFELADQHTDRSKKLQAIMGVPADCNSDDAVTIQGLLRTHLMKAGKPAYGESSLIDFAEGYEMILAMGGIPCYPVLIDGVSPINPYEANVEGLIEDLKARGVHCAELIPVRNAPETLYTYVKALREAEIIVTAGTEHNTLDMLPLTPTCRNGAPIPEELQDLFYEGACVAVAHQYLSARNETGYVDKYGKLNSSYSDSEDRIAALASLGETVLHAVIGKAAS
jgi:hypothetical protein